MASSKMTLIGMNIFMLNMNDDLFKNLSATWEAIHCGLDTIS